MSVWLRIARPVIPTQSGPAVRRQSTESTCAAALRTAEDVAPFEDLHHRRGRSPSTSGIVRQQAGREDGDVAASRRHPQAFAQGIEQRDAARLACPRQARQHVGRRSGLAQVVSPAKRAGRRPVRARWQSITSSMRALCPPPVVVRPRLRHAPSRASSTSGSRASAPHARNTGASDAGRPLPSGRVRVPAMADPARARGRPPLPPAAPRAAHQRHGVRRDGEIGEAGHEVRATRSILTGSSAKLPETRAAAPPPLQVRSAVEGIDQRAAVIPGHRIDVVVVPARQAIPSSRRDIRCGRGTRTLHLGRSCSVWASAYSRWFPGGGRPNLPLAGSRGSPFPPGKPHHDPVPGPDRQPGAVHRGRPHNGQIFMATGRARRQRPARAERTPAAPPRRGNWGNGLQGGRHKRRRGIVSRADISAPAWSAQPLSRVIGLRGPIP